MKAKVQSWYHYSDIPEDDGEWETSYEITGDDIVFKDGFIWVFNKSKTNGNYYTTPQEIYCLSSGERALIEGECV